MTGDTNPQQRPPDHPTTVRSSAQSNGAERRVEATEPLHDPPDGDAARRDLAAEVRDRYAEIRDHNAEVRDSRVSGGPDPRGVRRWAATDREAAAEDRGAAAADRQHARDDRDVASWESSLAQQTQGRLLDALNDTDDLAESILHIGQAQGILMNDSNADAAGALIALEDRATRDHVGLREAARRIIAESSLGGTGAVADPGGVVKKPSPSTD